MGPRFLIVEDQTLVRQLVIARNHRRARKGLAPLDIEAEIARELSELRDI